MDIVYIFDENLVVCASVSIVSLPKNNRGGFCFINNHKFWTFRAYKFLERILISCPS